MDRPGLDDALSNADADGYLLDASQDDANQLYLSGFTGPDPFLTLYADGRVHLLVSGLEYGRARSESDADVVERHADYDYGHGDRDARYDMYAEFVRTNGAESVLVPPRGPVGTADALRDRGIGVAVDDDDILTTVRAVKTDEEVEAIREAQRANEAAMAAAEELLAGADIAGESIPVDEVARRDSPPTEDDDPRDDDPRDDEPHDDDSRDDNPHNADPTRDDTATVVEPGTLVHDGAVLTSERVKAEIERTLLDHGCALDETIVAGGRQAADPHDRGSGPLRANEAIVIDVFPRSKTTKYNADMTRTFCVGEPSTELRDRYELTEAALAAALEAVGPGVTGEEVHAAACEVYEDAGHATFRTDPDTETGFIHSTGHGIGLDVHELPRLATGGGELEPGHVVTVEPGLYDPAVGGVRIEDLVVVTEDGHENLTNYPIEFVVE